MRLVVFINHTRGSGQTHTVAQAARAVAEAHRAGWQWDARRATDKLGCRYVPLNEAEAAELVAAVAAEIAN